MQTYVEEINKAFKAASNSEIANGQQAYMKHKFEFFGIKSTERRAIQRPFFLKEQRPVKAALPQVINTLWVKPQRELQYCGQELALKYIKNQEKKDIELYEFMITHKSWWDTVDFIASKLIGGYFKTFPDQRWLICEKWLQSENIWLQRATLLFQLKYKTDVDTKLLEHNIHFLLGSNEFFINKAIGWILREYSKTNSEWVISFTAENKLDKLSQREALKWLNRKNR